MGSVGVGDPDNPQYNMVAYDGSGSVRWMVLNDQPQITTADGGVIGQSGITYDKNGSATGQLNGNGASQIRSLPIYSWTQQWYGSAGGEVNALIRPGIDWAVGYGSATGGNPSASGTSVGVAEKVEGLPVFALPLRGPTCTLPSGGGVEVALSGTALAMYTTQRQNLLDGNYLTSQSCSTFFESNAFRAPFAGRLATAVNSQVPFDGSLTTISQYAAGMSNGKDPTDVQIKRIVPVCGLFVPFHGRYGVVPPQGLVVAASRIPSFRRGADSHTPSTSTQR